MYSPYFFIFFFFFALHSKHLSGGIIGIKQARNLRFLSENNLKNLAQISCFSKVHSVKLLLPVHQKTLHQVWQKCPFQMDDAGLRLIRKA